MDQSKLSKRYFIQKLFASPKCQDKIDNKTLLHHIISSSILVRLHQKLAHYLQLEVCFLLIPHLLGLYPQVQNIQQTNWWISMCDYKSRLCCAFSHPQWLALHGYDQSYDDNLNRYTHVFFGSDSLWDPFILDHKFTAHDFDDPDISCLCHENNDPRVDDFGHMAVHHAHVHSIVETFTVLAQTVFAMTVAALSAFPQHLHPYLPVTP
jgi:hypothetical protein